MHGLCIESALGWPNVRPHYVGHFLTRLLCRRRIQPFCLCPQSARSLWAVPRYSCRGDEDILVVVTMVDKFMPTSFLISYRLNKAILHVLETTFNHLVLSQTIGLIAMESLNELAPFQQCLRPDSSALRVASSRRACFEGSVPLKDPSVGPQLDNEGVLHRTSTHRESGVSPLPKALFSAYSF